MKNKLIIWLLSLVSIASILSSCQKKLEEYNPSDLTANTVFNKAIGFETLVDAAYSYSRYWYGKEEGYSLTEMGTDIWTNGSGDVYPQLSTYNNLQGNNTGALDLEWNNFYAAINLCNTGIAQVGGVADYTATQKTTREAELRFLRAFYYWHIVETWGGVHYSTKASDGVITTANRSPVDSFYNLIFTDLQYAATNLPATTTSYGRVTIPVAKAFLARAYLSHGMNAPAIAMANDVIKNYGFTLLPNYADLWDMSKLKNKEVIWAIDYSTNLALNDLATSSFPTGHSRGSNSGHLMFGMVYDQVNTGILIRDIPNGRPFNRYMPTLALLDMFDEKNDSRFNASFQSTWLVNKAATGFAINDTAAYCPKGTWTTAQKAAKKYTTYDYSAVYGTGGVPSQRKFYISLKKFLDPTRTSVAEAQSARDAYVIRLAELYLIAAEAEVNISKPDSAAYYVNILRTRAATPGNVAAMQVLPAQMNIDFILDERARELCGEQLRWFDLKRTGKLIDRIKTKNLNPDAATFVQTYHLLRPIPQSQIDAVTNKTEFKQNPGYQ
ncbi:MAG: RagB/SusD family nutrient uptake outer membrane protein [Sediminibacterium sp.]